MADVTITRRIHRMTGSKHEFELIFTTTAATGTVQTGLGWVEYASMQGMDANDNNVRICKNSLTASATEDDPGVVYFAGAATSNTYRMIAKGR